MIDVTHLAAIRNTTTIKQSHTSWGIRFGRHQFEVTRMREARTIGRYVPFVASQATRPIWPLAIGTFASVSAFGLFVFGAVASEPSLPGGRSQYIVSVPVPGRTSKVSIPVPNRRTASHRAIKKRSIDPTFVVSGSHFDAGDEPYVVKALRSGEFQEWLGSDGQRRFLNAGPEQTREGERCRDLALLVRQADGSSHARNARRCIGGSVPSTVVATQIGGMEKVASRSLDETSWAEPASAQVDRAIVERAAEQ